MADYFSNPDLPIAVLRDSRRWSSPMHSHDFAELVVVLSGHGFHQTARGAYPIEAGDAFVIEAHQPHGYRIPKALYVVNILYDEARLQLPMLDLRTMPGFNALFTLEPIHRERYGMAERLRMDKRQQARAEALIRSLETEAARRHPGHIFMCTTLFMELVGHLSRCYAEAQQSGEHSPRGIAEAMSHIERCYAEPVTVADLARIARMSESAFHRAFKAATGRAPIDYLVRLRVQRACERLRNTGLSISAVATAVGFTDASYFARQFRKVIDETPSSYRARSRRSAAA
jgi:AraC-like DNA-binding protein